MGYGVYQDPVAPYRWAGYGVPAECDWPGCTAEIDRGLGFKCEEHVTYILGDVEVIEEGCGLFFCSDHRYDAEGHERDDVTPKPDSTEWIRHVLTDQTWEPWRQENPERTETLRAELTNRTTTPEETTR